ncbi:MAG: membrane protein insertase YidC [bacterium]|nr:MAG: membrane protein insertase YidC [bacterium]
MDDQIKRLILAVAISFVFLFVWQSYFAPSPPTPEEETGPVVEEIVPADREPDAGLLPPPETGEVFPEEGPGALQESAEKQVVVRTPLYTAVLTNRGGGIKSYRLMKFLEDPREPESFVEMVRSPRAETLPLSAEFTAAGGPLGLQDALFVIEGRDMLIEEGQEASAGFRFRTEEGLEMVKTFTFSGDNYGIKTDVKILNRGPAPLNGRLSLVWEPGLEPLAEEKEGGPFGGGRYGYQGALALVGDKTRKIKPGKVDGTQDLEYLPQWIATTDMYFTAAMIPVSGADGSLARKQEDGRMGVALTSQVRLLTGQASAMKALVYIGPKEMVSLRTVDETLRKTINLGFFGFIAQPLMDLLNFFYKYVKNYGLSIIILTILIKIFFIPFSTASHRSMKKMSRLNPQINALRERYKKDREKLNQEIMALYREHRVNPAGGCLPILVQIPVFFALYRALLGAIELRHAPFFLWITDLSAKDPYYITPIIMGGTMFLQQKMTPAAGDPRQQKIMLFMPIMFTALFLNFPAGLVIYWLVNNVLTIGHQYYLNKRDDKSLPEPEPVKVKKGKGKK